MKQPGDSARIKRVKSGWLAQCRNCRTLLAHGDDDLMVMPIQGAWWFDEPRGTWRPTKGHKRRRTSLRHATDSQPYDASNEVHWAQKQRFEYTGNFTRRNFQLPDDMKRDTNMYSSLLPTRFACPRCGIESSIPAHPIDVEGQRDAL